VLDFIAIDFETGNPQRVSACAIGYARVVNGQVVESSSHLIRPVGGHAPFQSKIHGIKHEHTVGRPDFGEMFPEIHGIFQGKLVAHSLFDKQVLSALSSHFGLRLDFEYLDTSSLAKQMLPKLENHKLKTLAKHFRLPNFKHHDAHDDAVACANICLKLHEAKGFGGRRESRSDEMHELKGLIRGILADNEVNYKEAYELLYWLQDHQQTTDKFPELLTAVRQVLEDDKLDGIEADLIRRMLSTTSLALE